MIKIRNLYLLILIGSLSLFVFSCASSVNPDNPLDPAGNHAASFTVKGPYISEGAQTTATITDLTITHNVYPTPDIIWESRDGLNFTSRLYPVVAATAAADGGVDGFASIKMAAKQREGNVTTTFSWDSTDLTDNDSNTLTYYVKYMDTYGATSGVYTSTITGPSAATVGPSILAGSPILTSIRNVTINHKIPSDVVQILDSKDGVTFVNRSFTVPAVSEGGSGFGSVKMAVESSTLKDVTTTFSWDESDLMDADGTILSYYAKYVDASGNTTSTIKDTVEGPSLDISVSGVTASISNPSGKTYSLARVSVTFSGAATETTTIAINTDYSSLMSSTVTGNLVKATTTVIPDGRLTNSQFNTVYKYQKEFDVQISQDDYPLPSELYVRVGNSSIMKASIAGKVALTGFKSGIAPLSVKIYITQDSQGDTPFGDDDQVSLVQNAAGAGGVSGAVPVNAGNPASGAFRIKVAPGQKDVDGTMTDVIYEEIRLFQDKDSNFYNGHGLLLTASGTYNKDTNPGYIQYTKSSAIHWKIQSDPYRTWFTGSQTYIHAQFRGATDGVSAPVTVLYTDKTP